MSKIKIADPYVEGFLSYLVVLGFVWDANSKRKIDHTNWNTCAVGQYAKYMGLPEYDYGKSYRQWPILFYLYDNTDETKEKIREVIHTSETYTELATKIVKTFTWD